MFEYHKAVAVVTGASSGIGRQIATDLVERGAHVVGVVRRVDEMATLSEARACDLRDLEAWVALLRDVEASHGRIDVLVNGAGVERRKGIGEVAWDDVEDALTVNFRAAARAMVLIVPGMLARNRGAVLNISSDHGRAPGPGTPAYCASKAALSAFTESVAHEVAGTGVHVHVLYPGWVPTPLSQRAIDTGMPKPRSSSNAPPPTSRAWRSTRSVSRGSRSTPPASPFLHPSCVRSHRRCTGGRCAVAEAQMREDASDRFDLQTLPVRERARLFSERVGEHWDGLTDQARGSPAPRQNSFPSGSRKKTLRYAAAIAGAKVSSQATVAPS